MKSPQQPGLAAGVSAPGTIPGAPESMGISPLILMAGGRLASFPGERISLGSS